MASSFLFVKLLLPYGLIIKLIAVPAFERPVGADVLLVAVADGYPVAAGHTLVVPRRHVASVFDLAAEEYAAVWELVGYWKGER